MIHVFQCDFEIASLFNATGGRHPIVAICQHHMSLRIAWSIQWRELIDNAHGLSPIAAL